MVSTTVRRLSSIMTVLATLGLAGAPAAFAQLDRSRCADCHFANPYTEPAQQHLHRWSLSPHQRADVGCDSCHGGNPDTFESLQAHRGVLSSFNPSSPVHRTQLPVTCGSCHMGPLCQLPGQPAPRAAGPGRPPRPDLLDVPRQRRWAAAVAAGARAPMRGVPRPRRDRAPPRARGRRASPAGRHRQRAGVTGGGPAADRACPRRRSQRGARGGVSCRPRSR